MHYEPLQMRMVKSTSDETTVSPANDDAGSDPAGGRIFL